MSFRASHPRTRRNLFVHNSPQTDFAVGCAGRVPNFIESSQKYSRAFCALDYYTVKMASPCLECFVRECIPAGRAGTAPFFSLRMLISGRKIPPGYVRLNVHSSLRNLHSRLHRTRARLSRVLSRMQNEATTRASERTQTNERNMRSRAASL